MGKEMFVVYSHGFNGSDPFTEAEDVVATLDKAKALAQRIMEKDRYANTLDDGTPTILWMEVFGPGIRESLGLEARDGTLEWTGI